MPYSKEIGTDAQPKEENVKLTHCESATLKDILQTRLIECGWRRQIEQFIREKIAERGNQTITSEELAAEIVPQARAMVPEDVRNEMMIRVREALESSLTRK
ncbi:enhancer of yellow 2b transcription factor [Drosophila guanche]|uniref:Enhancer of yellow 2 transcription factor n=1 Tax=Drosophila guanche TaxID=7266 RepID=A0A3B0KGH6_DROGU|nr:enhancer of yellow 2b transcription factor [Drosophila guanche]SPP84171.1 blast:Enhancer of yellow 2b transcription factor [Drosophila guanche]